MPRIAISADFLTAYSKIPRAQQKKVRDFINRFRIDPTAASINYEPLNEVKDSRVRSVRIDLSYRAIVLHPDKGDIYVLLWVDHHDEAIAWAKRRVFEINPYTGALQVLDTEALEAAATLTQTQQTPQPLEGYGPFYGFSDQDLLRTGLPKPLLPAIRALRSPQDLDQLESYLPPEAYEALYWIANLGYSVDQAIAEVSASRPEQVDTTDLETALKQPDSQRRFVMVESAEELMDILNAPLEKWRVFLHPSQARLVRRHFNGPARVLGGAGTGKTVVAMHRARHLAREVFTAPTDRILFTTFTRNLANNIRENLRTLCGSEFRRIEVTNLHAWAYQFMASEGIHFDMASNEEIKEAWKNAIAVAGGDGSWDRRFYQDEWRFVVQAQNITERREYLRASRRGRRTRLTRPQRAVIWEVFEAYRDQLHAWGKIEWYDLIHQARLYLQKKGAILPYKAIVVDETQDLHPEELRLLRQMVPPGPNDLFFVGDAHQRIYGRPVVMSHLGINIRGRGNKLRINYRTTEEIQRWTVGLLEGRVIDDLDGGVDSLAEYISLMHGPTPIIRQFDTLDEEIAFILGGNRSPGRMDPAGTHLRRRQNQ